jgi:hypothetical protein
VDNRTGQELFAKDYSAPRYSKVYWLYALPSDFEYAQMLRGLYAQAVQDLRREVAEKLK